MKKMVLVIALAAIALSGSAFAQDPNYRDNIGIYVDEAGTDNCAFMPLGAGSAYVVLTQLTSNEILGWEAKITYSNVTVMSTVLRGENAINLASKADEFIVGFSAPLPAIAGTIVIADLNLFITNADPGYAFADEVYFSVLENGLPAYVDGTSAPFTLHPALGDVSDPIFFVNDAEPCVVAIEETSFGSVKSLFR